MATPTTHHFKDKLGDLSHSERYARAVAALVLLLYPMVLPTAPLGLIALLPLIAIYPMFSAIVGWDPVRYVLNNSESAGLSRFVARSGLVVIGTGLIAGTMLSTVSPLGGLSILALLGILPIFVAIFGENPVTALLDSSQHGEENPQNIEQTQDEIRGNVVEYASRDAQKSSRRDHVPTHHEAA